MKTFSLLWQYLATFFLEWEMFWAHIVEKIKTHILYSITFFRKSHCLWDNVEKCGGDRGASNDVTIWRIRVACWISKSTSMHAHVHAHTSGHPHVRTQAGACARTRTYTQICNTSWFSTATIVRERASVLCYTYITSIVYPKIEKRCQNPHITLF